MVVVSFSSGSDLNLGDLNEEGSGHQELEAASPFSSSANLESTPRIDIANFLANFQNFVSGNRRKGYELMA